MGMLDTHDLSAFLCACNNLIKLEYMSAHTHQLAMQNHPHVKERICVKTIKMKKKRKNHDQNGCLYRGEDIGVRYRNKRE